MPPRADGGAVSGTTERAHPPSKPRPAPPVSSTPSSVRHTPTSLRLRRTVTAPFPSAQTVPGGGHPSHPLTLEQQGIPDMPTAEYENWNPSSKVAHTAQAMRTTTRHDQPEHRPRRPAVENLTAEEYAANVKLAELKLKCPASDTGQLHFLIVTRFTGCALCGLDSLTILRNYAEQHAPATN